MRKVIRMKHALLAICGSVLLAFTGVASAGLYTYTAFGVDFTIDATNGGSGFTLRIENAFSTTDEEWDNAEFLGALGFKDLGIDFKAAGVSATLTSVPAGTTSWNYLQGELDASGCKDPSGQKGVICFSGLPQLEVTDDMLFTVALTNAVLNINAVDGPHLKLQFLREECKTKRGVETCELQKEGSLLSVNIPGANGNGNGGGGGGSNGNGNGNGNGNNVPEPATLALVGLSLLGLAAARRRRQA